MSKKNMLDPLLKVRLVEKYLKGEIGVMEACRQAGLSNDTHGCFYRWINIYKNEGPPGFLNKGMVRHYSKELKLAAVFERRGLKNGGSQEIRSSFRISALKLD